MRAHFILCISINMVLYLESYKVVVYLLNYIAGPKNKEQLSSAPVVTVYMGYQISSEKCKC